MFGNFRIRHRPKPNINSASRHDSGEDSMTPGMFALRLPLPEAAWVGGSHLYKFRFRVHTQGLGFRFTMAYCSGTTGSVTCTRKSAPRFKPAISQELL